MHAQWWIFLLLAFASSANAITMEMTHVTGLHIETSVKIDGTSTWLISVDSTQAGHFSGVICTNSTDDEAAAVAVIQKSQREDLPLDLILYVDQNTICLQAVRVSN
jgi:hypothetical protein